MPTVLGNVLYQLSVRVAVSILPLVQLGPLVLSKGILILSVQAHVLRVIGVLQGLNCPQSTPVLLVVMVVPLVLLVMHALATALLGMYVLKPLV